MEADNTRREALHADLHTVSTVLALAIQTKADAELKIARLTEKRAQILRDLETLSQ